MFLVNNTNANLSDIMTPAEITAMIEAATLPDELTDIFILTRPEGYTDRLILDWA